MAKRFRVAKRPPKSNVRMKAIRKRIDSRMQTLLDEHLALRQKIVKTWQNHKPTFQKQTLQTRKNITEWRVFYNVAGKVTAPDTTQGKSVYRLLNDGTKVRYVRMSMDWVSKTAVGVIDSRYGKGYAVKSMKDMGGIEARGWETTHDRSTVGLINAILEPKTEKTIVKGFKNGFFAIKRK